jgi:hypothetical protein
MVVFGDGGVSLVVLFRPSVGLQSQHVVAAAAAVVVVLVPAVPVAVAVVRAAAA